MAQTIIVILIIAIAALVAAYKFYKFFSMSNDDAECSPDKCAACPSHVRETCDNKDLRRV
jgi:hypothetical protein